jgi:hypothetical protein
MSLSRQTLRRAARSLRASRRTVRALPAAFEHSLEPVEACREPRIGCAPPIQPCRQARSTEGSPNAACQQAPCRHCPTDSCLVAAFNRSSQPDSRLPRAFDSVSSTGPTCRQAFPGLWQFANASQLLEKWRSALQTCLLSQARQSIDPSTAHRLIRSGDAAVDARTAADHLGVTRLESERVAAASCIDVGSCHPC